jgi:hypothetical protein
VLLVGFLPATESWEVCVWPGHPARISQEVAPV